MLKKEVGLLAPGLLAYIGDCVYELQARSYLLEKGYRTSNNVHQAAVKLVKASAQARALLGIVSALNQEEKRIVRRGWNAKTGRRPANVKIADYRLSTGIEALFGYHFLCGNEERIYHLWDLVVASVEQEQGNR